MGVLGRSADGAFAEYIRLPEVSAIHLSPKVDYAEASLYEPFATAIHALQKADVSGKNVLILGPGTIGLMACEAAKAMGAAQVISVGSNPKRLQFSLEVGADKAINRKEEDFVKAVQKHCPHLDAVIDFTGNTEMINQSIDILSCGGTLVLVGMIESELSIPKYMYRVVYRELKITGIFGRHLYTTWDILENLLECGKVKLNRYVGEQVPLSQYEKGLEHFSQLIGRAVFLPEET
jgi:threonine 3-dehydrogenase